MKIFSADQLRAADRATIENENIASLDLMERASQACVHHLMHLSEHSNQLFFVCGRGNNGGDGLAIARLLQEKFSSDQPSKKIFVFFLSGSSASDDFLINLERIKKIHSISLVEIGEKELDFLKESLGNLSPTAVLIDCIFGTGLNKPVSGFHSELIKTINNCARQIISIDMPSGLLADSPANSDFNSIVHAELVLTFHAPKLSLLMAENAQYCGDFILIDIGLDKKFVSSLQSSNNFITKNEIIPLLKNRKKFGHKGTYGHALLVCGSEGMFGAALLSVAACLRSGAGLVSTHVPSAAVDLIHGAAPEALVSSDEESLFISSLKEFGKYNSIGLGPGLGTLNETASVIKYIIQQFSGKMVLDADALNILSENKTWLGFLRSGTIITPHPKEFDRLFGAHSSDFSRLETAKTESARHGIIIVLKGAHTAIVLPSGSVYFNSTGNPGMAKGGCGDVLTGLLTGLLARGYLPQEASILGVYLHGLAGDLAAEELGAEAMKAGDVIEFLARAFKKIESFF